MRVISGKAGGIKLDSLEGNETRPTTDRVKESLFSSIQFEIRNSKVLDLFSGSGALGIEASSRGAKEVVLIEQNKKCEISIMNNIKKTRLTNIKLYIKDSFDFLSQTTEKFDIIFLDPPYKKELEIKAIEYILKYNILKENGLIIIEKDKKDKLNFDFEGLELIKEKKYGNTVIVILRRNI
ncbi:MAG: 16S rRNA (guanine(966)-N(2))-methyltransferase RsmD [Bacillota bacterium]|nr:16S rRNA (guanine(966)-N(2))-methyltransferase RsmD [Bacillota bacterium]